MSIELGTFGVWRRVTETGPEQAQEIEALGYGALWVGGSPDGELREVEGILAATDSIPVATGIVNMWRDQATTVARSYRRINERFPNRFLLGVGIGHPEATAEYRRPYETMVRYLDDLDAGGVPVEHLVLAALGPRALRLAGERTVGAHPYLTTPRHTRLAREVLGDGPLLAPEQTVVVGGDPAESRQSGREFVSRYLRLVNYRNNLLREGWSESDLADGGSDRLVSELVLTGNAAEVARGLRGHVEAGAQHVCIQDVGPEPIASLRELAEVLFD